MIASKNGNRRNENKHVRNGHNLVGMAIDSVARTEVANHVEYVAGFTGIFEITTLSVGNLSVKVLRYHQGFA